MALLVGRGETSERWNCFRRLLARWQLGEQVGGGIGDAAHRSFERFLRLRRRARDAADFTDILTGGGLDLFVRGVGLEAPQSRDVSAHVDEVIDSVASIAVTR